MSVSTDRHLRTPDATQVVLDRRASGSLPRRVHVLLDIGVADDCAQVRGMLGAFATFGAVAGIPVDLGTAGGPRSVGRLEPLRLEQVARHLGAFARGFDGAPVLSHAIERTGRRLPRLAHALGDRPLAVLFTARPPADRVATGRAIGRSARRGLPWLVVTTSQVDASAFAPAVAAAPDAVAVTEVTDLSERHDTLVLAVVDAWDRLGANGR